MRSYYVVCTPCFGDPEKVSWYPGCVGRMFVRANPPPVMAAYRTTSRLAAARIVRSAVRDFGWGHWPAGPAAPRNYQPASGDVLVSVVCPLRSPDDAAPPRPLVAATFFPDGRRVQDMTRVPADRPGGVVRLAAEIAWALRWQAV